MQFAFAEQESVRQGMMGAEAGESGGYGVNTAWKSLPGRTWTVSTGQWRLQEAKAFFPELLSAAV